jgi:3-oxoacyl-[acyl-carrier protein] reductase
MKRFDEIQIGDFAEIVHTITDADIKKFVDLTGDDNKLHVDKEYASKTSFKKPVAHGMLGASFISTIIGTKIPGDGALWFSQSLEFLMPVRVGDTLTIRGEVIGKNARENVIELKTDIHNQHKQKVTNGTAKVKVVEHEVEKVEEDKTEEVGLKNALVIGASGGIGEAICQKLAEQGYNIGVHYNSNKSKADALSESLASDTVKAFSIQGDLLTDKGVEQLVEQTERKLGHIDIVINASTVKFSNIKFDKLDWQDIDDHININIKANFLLLKYVVPQMKERKRGKIIFLTTQYTESTPPAELIHYNTAKYALNGFAKSLAVELGPFNVQVNLVSPGMTETELISDVPEKARLVAASKAPLRRLAKPADVANAVAFLASNDSNYITGETIRVNGGQTML